MFEYIGKKRNSKNIVLFIHGFTSNNDTWVNSKGISFPNMLLENDTIRDNFNFAYVSYDTQLIGFYKTKATLSFLSRHMFGTNTVAKKSLDILQLSDYISTTISLNCEEYNNIIIVAHSMGGLVSKGFILKDLEQNKFTKVKMLLSLAVPHNGSDWSKVGKRLFKQNKQIIDLDPLSKTLNDLTNKWLWQKEGLPKTAYVIAQNDEVVDETSSTAHENERQSQYFCRDNHFSITKPENDNTNSFLTVKTQLIRFIEENGVDVEVKQFNDQGQYDKEIFVLKLFLADVHEKIIDSSKETFYNAEYMTRYLLSRKIEWSYIESLYTKIKHLYSIYFGQLLSGKIKDSTELVTVIHEKILEEDRNFLKSSLTMIDALQKTGMLHQLANKLDDDIMWARENHIEKIEELKGLRENE
jgi:pimeloyl-ACP methyl ester carboxylesterase